MEHLQDVTVMRWRDKLEVIINVQNEISTYWKKDPKGREINLYNGRNGKKCIDVSDQVMPYYSGLCTKIHQTVL